MTPEIKKERQRIAVCEMDNVITEEMEELHWYLQRRHTYDWPKDPAIRLNYAEKIRIACRAIRIQKWIRAMTVRGLASSLGLTA